MKSREMRSLIVFGVAALLSATPVQALPKAECEALWEKLDENEDGIVLAAKAAPYIADLKAANALERDTATLTARLFMKGCGDDLFKTAMPR